MTNFERIKSMSPEEFAANIFEVIVDTVERLLELLGIHYEVPETLKRECIQDIIENLKSEADNG